MSILKRVLSSLTFLCLTLSTGFAATELLYVQEGQTISTYSVNNTTAVSNKLGSLSTNFDPRLGIKICPSGSFLYVLGFISGNNEMFTVYSLTATGVPIATPIQKLTVKPALSQFLIHPNGRVAYAMFSWEQVVGGEREFVSDIVLFTINPKTGKLTNTTKPVANFPLNRSFSTSIYGMDSQGTKLYTEFRQIVGGPKTFIHYSYSTINAKTGALGKQIGFWSDEFDVSKQQQSVFFDALIAQLKHDSSGNGTINIYPNKAGVNPNAPLIKCTREMLAVCGDGSFSPMIDPSGNYLVFGDSTIDETTIVYINSVMKKVQASRASIPGYSPPLVFSPDGLLLYGSGNPDISVYVFNPHSGEFTANGTINALADQFVPGKKVFP
jgi:hypothetical protein